MLRHRAATSIALSVVNKSFIFDRNERRHTGMEKRHCHGGGHTGGNCHLICRDLISGSPSSHGSCVFLSGQPGRKGGVQTRFVKSTQPMTSLQGSIGGKI